MNKETINAYLKDIRSLMDVGKFIEAHRRLTFIIGEIKHDIKYEADI